MYLTCPKCGSDDIMLEFSSNQNYIHACKDEDILSFIKGKDDEIARLNNRVLTLEDAVKSFCFHIREYLTNRGIEIIPVSRELIEDLYRSSLADNESLINFVYLYHSLYSVWLETLELFCDKPSRSYKSGDYGEKIELIRTHLLQAYQVMFNKTKRDNNEIITTEELLRRIRNER